MKVFKYDLSVGETILSLQRGTKILSAQAQGPRLQLWALVPVDQPMEYRRVHVGVTGEMLPAHVERFTFVDTVQMDWLVLHIFVEDLS